MDLAQNRIPATKNKNSNWKVPNSLFEGSNSVSPSWSHDETYTKSATKLGMWHFKIAAFPFKTYSSMTLTSYFWDTTENQNLFSNLASFTINSLLGKLRVNFVSCKLQWIFWNNNKTSRYYTNNSILIQIYNSLQILYETSSKVGNDDGTIYQEKTWIEIIIPKTLHQKVGPT